MELLISLLITLGFFSSRENTIDLKKYAGSEITISNDQLRTLSDDQLKQLSTYGTITDKGAIIIIDKDDLMNN